METNIKVLTEDEIKQYDNNKYKFSVYLTTNLINNNIYVGVHRTKKLMDDYIGSGTRIKRAIKKYGVENFKKEIIAVFNNKEDMLRKEAEIVNSDFLKRGNVYNIDKGGNGGGSWEGKHHTEETKAKMRAKANRQPRSEESRRKMRIAWIGRDTSNYTHKVTQKQRDYYSSLWKGCVWMKNEELKLQRQIKPNSDEYNKLIKEGWVVGQLKKELNWVWLKNVITRKEERIDKKATDTINSLLNNGWEYGRIACYNKEYREWASKNGFKRVWVSNNELKLSTRVYKETDEYNKMINNGWFDGRINYVPKNKLIK